MNLNEKLRKEVNVGITPLEWMDRGEIGFDPTYYTQEEESDSTSNNEQEKEEEGEKVLIPNPFIIDEHFEAAIHGLENRIQLSHEGSTDSSVYDPNDRSMAEPTPVNPVILPDLYLGWGDAKFTHTKQEILRNRLFAVLLTKLSFNYECCSTRDRTCSNSQKQQNGGNNGNDQDSDDGPQSSSYFVVRMKNNGKSIMYPDEFIEALLETGHTVEVCPRSAITTFGVAACIKEKNGTWTNIPLAVFLRTGYEQQDQRPAYFSAPHGGLDLKVSVSRANLVIELVL